MSEINLSINEMDLINRDVILQEEDQNEYSGSSIFIMDSKRNIETRFYTVLRVSNQVTQLEPGDIAVIPWSKTMIPFEVKEGKVTITSEDDVLGVIKKEDIDE